MVRRVAVSDASPVRHCLHEHEPAEYFDAVSCPLTVLHELLWYDVLNSDIDFANSYEPEESGADTIAHGARARIAIMTTVALSQFI